MDMIVPPFAGVKLVEYQDRIALTPVYWVREFVGLGKCPVAELPAPADFTFSSILWKSWAGKEVWVVARWLRYDDGREEVINLNNLDPEATEEDARDAYESMIRFANHTKEELLQLSTLFEASDDDLAYIENRFPDGKFGPPERGSVDERDLYQARLKVLGGMHPKTVALIAAADLTENAQERDRLEREAVHAFFAEMAHQWTEDEVIAWQRSNPIGSEWMCEFAKVFREPERTIDPINYELARNWLHGKYNLLTEEELSDAIFVRTGQRLMPGTLKKRRERLGLTTKRPPGPRPNFELESRD